MSGVTCRYHPHALAEFECAGCHLRFCSKCVKEISGNTYCKVCQSRLKVKVRREEYKEPLYASDKWGILIGLILVFAAIFLLLAMDLGRLRSVIECSVAASVAFFIAVVLFVPKRFYSKPLIRGPGFVGLILSTASAVGALGLGICCLILFPSSETDEEVMFAQMLALYSAIIFMGLTLLPSAPAAVLFDKIKPKRASIIIGIIIAVLLGAAYLSLAHFILWG